MWSYPDCGDGDPGMAEPRPGLLPVLHAGVVDIADRSISVELHWVELQIIRPTDLIDLLIHTYLPTVVLVIVGMVIMVHFLITCVCVCLWLTYFSTFATFVTVNFS
jgi:hypothetical protein